MQTFHQSSKFLLALSMCMTFSMIFVNATSTDKVYKIPDKEIKLTFNGKTIDLKRGIVLSDFNKVEENKLLIELTSKASDPNQNVNLELILARGTRPVHAKDLISFSGQVEVDITNLLLDAKPGDRIVLAINDGKTMVISINIS